MTREIIISEYINELMKKSYIKEFHLLQGGKAVQIKTADNEYFKTDKDFIIKK